MFCGADFSSLEDRISALTTKDPNKLKVYTDGFDGHCLRSYYYWPEAYVGIADTPEAINGTKDTHAEYRQKGKAPTFALTYQGTWVTLMNNCGFSEEESKGIEANFLKMYVVSTEWVRKQLIQATHDGYVTVAFGLRVRTPMLAQVVLGTSKTPYEAEAEGRTAGNAMGQSYGLLNSRAMMMTMKDVRSSKERLNIRPAAQIHDACYFYVRDNWQSIKFLNDNLGTHMSWQALPAIEHDEVHLSGELDIFYPSWKYATNLPNNISVDEIKAKVIAGAAKYNK